MFVVALTRWGRAESAYRGGSAIDPSREAASLAALLGLSAYDAKLRLGTGLPVVLGRFPSAQAARELLITIRARGHGAVACDATRVEASASMTSPRELRLESEGLAEARGNSVPDLLMPYAEIAALVRATHAESEETTREHSEKRLGIGRAVMTMGVVTSRTIRSVTRAVQERHAPVLYIFRQRGERHVILRQDKLRYGGLGELVAKTAGENFSTLVGVLRERAPHAHYDDRLVSQRRRPAEHAVSGSLGTSIVTISNSSETDLAAHLIAVAALGDQL